MIDYATELSLATALSGTTTARDAIASIEAAIAEAESRLGHPLLELSEAYRRLQRGPSPRGVRLFEKPLERYLRPPRSSHISDPESVQDSRTDPRGQLHSGVVVRAHRSCRSAGTGVRRNTVRTMRAKARSDSESVVPPATGRARNRCHG